MRRFLIDTDTGTDDAVAIIMALRDKNIKVEAFTTVCGNVGVDQATENCLISIEKADTYCPPVYKGCERPILREKRKVAFDAHGLDGMGDLGLKAEKLQIEKEHAVDFLIDYIEANPNELELVTIGPVTNLAIVSHKSPQTLGKLKCIWMMMGTGLYFGNTSPLSEGNASMDPEALDIVLKHADTPIYLLGWDLCINEYLFTEDDIARIYATGSPIAKFCLDINHTLVTLNEKRFGRRAIDFADPVAMAIALQPYLIEESYTAYTRCETNNGLAYGAISVDVFDLEKQKKNAMTVTKINAEQMKKCIIDRIV